jgi:hypothetical protein
MPRSGTNWVSQILASAPQVRLKFSPLFSYEFKNALDARSPASAWRSMFEAVYETPGDFLDQEYLRRRGLVPRFAERDVAPRVLATKTTRFHHLSEGLLDKAPYVRLVVLIRHPVAAVHSWLSNPREFPDGADPSTEWRTGACRKTAPEEFWGFNDWVSTTRRYHRLAERHPERVLLVRYEAVVADPAGQAARMLRHVGVEPGPQTAAFVAASTAGTSTHVQSVYKSASVAQRWRGEADPAIVSAIEAALRDTELACYLDDVAPGPGEATA